MVKLWLCRKRNGQTVLQKVPMPHTKRCISCCVSTFLTFLSLRLAHLPSTGSCDFTHLYPPCLPCRLRNPRALGDSQTCAAISAWGFPLLLGSPDCSIFRCAKPTFTHHQPQSFHPPLFKAMWALDGSGVGSSCSTHALHAQCPD